jgi:SAM-dependent methyltransferase
MQARGANPDEGHRRAYYAQTYERWHCHRSGITWFAPGIVAEPTFYDFLSRSFGWYYSSNRWDHQRALSLLLEVGCLNFVEVGCGPGEFLRAARASGITGIGLESNGAAANLARQDGLSVVPRAADLPAADGTDALVLLQVLEHWPDPVAALRTLLDELRPKWLLLSVPASDSLLGVLSDPLVWPPHHQTLWSARGLRVLGAVLGAKDLLQAAEPLTLSHFALALSQEPNGARAVLPRLGSWPGMRGRFLLGRALGLSWTRAAHTRLALYRLR